MSSSSNREVLTLLILGTVGLISSFLSSIIPIIGYLGLPLVVLIPGYCVMLYVAPGDNVAKMTTAFPMSLVVSSLYGLFLTLSGILNKITISAGLFTLSLALILFSRPVFQSNLSTHMQLSRGGVTILLAAIMISVLSNLGLLILFQYPVGYDVWSFMAESKLVAAGGSMPRWIDGSTGQLNFYPPLFPVFMGILLAITGAPVISVFWAAPLFFGAFFVVSVFSLARQTFSRMEVGLISALLVSTVGSSRFEGLDRAFPVSLAMVAFPTFLLASKYAHEDQSPARLLVASGSMTFLWLCFPPAGLLAALVIMVDGLLVHPRWSDLLTSVKISVLGAIPVVGYYLPYLASYGVPRNNFFAPWLQNFQSATIFSTSFLIALFNYSGLIVPATLALGSYWFLSRKKRVPSDRPALIWTFVSGLVLFSWELVFQGKLQFLGSVRFIPFLITALCILAACWIAPIFNGTRFDFSSFAPRKQIFGLTLLGLVIVSSAAITANGNYHEWLPPRSFPISSSYFGAALWLRDNSPSGSVVLTLDPLAQPLLVDVVGGNVHAVYDITTYAFWVPSSVVTAYSDTVTMLIGNNSASVQLLTSYNVSYILITASTVQYLSQIEGISQTQVENLLTSNFVNNSRFRWVYSDLSDYQLQAGLSWTELQKASSGTQLENLWNQLPDWTKSVFQAWLSRSGYNLYQLSWDQALSAIDFIGTPNLTSLAPTLNLSVLPLPAIYEVLHG